MLIQKYSNVVDNFHIIADCVIITTKGSRNFVLLEFSTHIVLAFTFRSTQVFVIVFFTEVSETCRSFKTISFSNRTPLICTQSYCWAIKTYLQFLKPLVKGPVPVSSCSNLLSTSELQTVLSIIIEWSHQNQCS